MARSTTTLTSLLALAVLAAAVGATLALMPANSIRKPTPASRSQHLSVFLDGYPSQVKVDNIEIESTRQAIGANEALYLRCSYRGLSHELYIAYWRAGNNFAYEATGHPPDKCWPAVGWRCTEERTNISVGTGKIRIGPLEWRKFSAPNQPEQRVIFWCMNGFQLVALGHRTTTSMQIQESKGFFESSTFLKFWRSRDAVIFDSSVGRIKSPSKQDVYFVRINTSDSLEVVLESEAFRMQLDLLERLGLRPSLVSTR